MAGIYIHVPFCRQACSYCDFYFVTRTQLIPDYVDALIREIESWRGTAWAEKRMETIYFGGGTPSTLSAHQLERILLALKGTFDISRLKEFTFELNPDDANRDYLMDLRSLGVDRLSMGVQSFDPHLLKFMHRSHTAEQAERSLELIRETGFKRYNADLIYGNPGQSDEMLTKDIDRLLAFDPPHISAYALTIEEGTRLGKLQELGRFESADDENVANQAIIMEERLAKAGLIRYEVSNYAIPGSEAIHNTNYWEHIPYLGLGPGAHSLWHEDASAWRWNNEKDITAWLNDPTSVRSEPETLTDLQRAEEYVLLRLRNKEGLDAETLRVDYRYTIMPEQSAYWANLVNMDLAHMGDKLRLTSSGFNLVDRITVEFLTRHDEI